MATAKDLRVAPIAAKDAAALVRRVHYSGKVVSNSQLHFGVFLGGRLEGAMSFGPSLDKRKIQGLVAGTGWNGFIELNRMAFSESLPRNSESRALGVAFRLIRKHYPQIEWVISFSDATQCGDGTIYRASGFVLTGIKKNTQIWVSDDGHSVSRTAMTAQGTKGASKQKREIISRITVTKGAHVTQSGAASMDQFVKLGYKPLPGFQLRYIYFLNPDARQRLTVPEIPFSMIGEMGAGMYRGEKITRTKEQDAGHPPALGGVTPTRALQSSEET